MFVGIHVPGEKPHGGSGSKGNHHHKSNRPHHRRRHHHLKSPSEAHRPGELLNTEGLFFGQVSLYQRQSGTFPGRKIGNRKLGTRKFPAGKGYFLRKFPGFVKN